MVKSLNDYEKDIINLKILSKKGFLSSKCLLQIIKFLNREKKQTK